MERYAWLFILAALICFILAAFSVRTGRVQCGWLGWAVLALYVVLDGWPAAIR
jgi:hypothetical protein